MTFKPFKPTRFDGGKPLLFFTKALPRTEVLGASPRIDAQNHRYLNQYLSGVTQNQNGPECDGNRTPALPSEWRFA